MSEKQPNDPGFRLEITADDPVVEIAIDVIGDDPQTPEQPPTYDVLYPDAQQTLADHIADVRANGDTFDRRKSLHGRYVAGQLAVPAVTAAELSAAAGTLTPAALATGVAGIGATIWHNIRQDRKILDAEREQYFYGCRGKVGQYYELYREAKIGDKSKDAGVTLFWYEPDEAAAREFGVVENLRQMARMAKEQDIKTMCVDARQLANISRHYTVKGPREDIDTLEVDALVREMKGVRLGQRNIELAKRVFAVESPQFWLDLTEDLQSDLSSEKSTKAFVAVIDQLERLKPNHPLLGPAKLYGNLDTQEAKEDFKAAVDKIVNPTLFRQEQYPERGKEFKNQGVPFTARHITDTEAGHVSDDAKDIIWQTRRNGFKKESIYKYYGLTQEQYANLLTTSGQSDPNLKIEDLVSAFEIAIIRASRGKPAEVEAETSTKEDVRLSPALTMSLQQYLMDSGIVGLSSKRKSKISTFPTRLRQGLAVGGALVALEIATGNIHSAIEAKEEYAVSVAKIQLANERRIDSQFVTEEDAQKYLDQNSWKWNAWHAYSKYEDYINKGWSDILPGSDGEDANSGLPASFNTGVSGIGNTNLPDRPDFTVTSHGGAEADGFWAASTANNLHILPSSIAQKFGAYWRSDFNLYNDSEINHQFPESLPEEYRNGPSLEVKRKLVLADQHEVNGQPYPVSLPVLEGTRPVAGNINGKEIELYKKEDNTYGIARSDSQVSSGDLTYWLIPDKNAPVPAPINGRELSITTNPGATIEEVKDLMGPRTADLLDDGLTKEAFGKTNELHENARIKSDEIGNTWKYTSTPFTEDQENSWNSLDDLIADAEKNKLANCNVANTIAGLQDPTSAQVMGYMNYPGSGSNILSTKESHQKRTDGDATPLVRAAPLPPETPFELPFSPSYIVLAGAGALLISQRKNMKQLAFKAAEGYDDKSRSKRLEALSAVPAEDIVEAHAAAEVLSYAPRLNASAVESSARRLRQTSQEQARVALTSSRLASHATAEMLAAKSQELQHDSPDLAARLALGAETLRQVAQVELDESGQPGSAVSGLARALAVAGKPFDYLRSRVKKY